MQPSTFAADQKSHAAAQVRLGQRSRAAAVGGDDCDSRRAKSWKKIAALQVAKYRNAKDRACGRSECLGVERAHGIPKRQQRRPTERLHASHHATQIARILN